MKEEQEKFKDPFDNEEYLFHYTNRQTLLEHILYNKQLKFGLLKNLNDPKEYKHFDFIFKDYNDHIRKSLKINNHIVRVNIINRVVKDYHKKFKIACFSKKDKNYGPGWAKSRMWAQYGECQYGACLIFNKKFLLKQIKFEYSTIFEDNVQYFKFENIYQTSSELLDKINDFIKNNSLSNHELEIKVNNLIKEYKTLLLFTKHVDFEAETEYRIIIETDDSKDKFIDINDSLIGIVVGERFPKAYKNIVGSEEIGYSELHYQNGHPILLLKSDYL